MPDAFTEMTALAKIRHLNILVKNLDVSWGFYKNILGFEYVYHLSPTKIVAAFNGFDFYIEQEDSWRGIDERVHFGLRTTQENVFAWAEHLRSHGISLVKGNNPAAEIYVEPDSNRVALYFQDPDGLTIEVYSPE